MDVALAIDAEAVTVQWFASIGAGSYGTDGKWSPGSGTSTDIQAAIQPATGRNLVDAPEGIRAESDFAIWTRSAIVLNQQIAYDGERYKIIWLAPRPQDGFRKGALGKVKAP
jgi:hypothetical protein